MLNTVDPIALAELSFITVAIVVQSSHNTMDPIVR